MKINNQNIRAGDHFENGNRSSLVELSGRNAVTHQ